MALLAIGKRRVIALTSTGGQAALCESDIQVVVLVPLIVQGWIKGEFVVGLSISDTFPQQSGGVVVGAESKATALGGKYLKGQVPGLDFARFCNAFKEILIVKSTETNV